MKKKDYERPMTQVVQLQHNLQLLGASKVGAKSNIKDWEEGETTDEQIYF